MSLAKLRRSVIVASSLGARTSTISGDSGFTHPHSFTGLNPLFNNNPNILDKHDQIKRTGFAPGEQAPIAH